MENANPLRESGAENSKRIVRSSTDLRQGVEDLRVVALLEGPIRVARDQHIRSCGDPFFSLSVPRLPAFEIQVAKTRRGIQVEIRVVHEELRAKTRLHAFAEGLLPKSRRALTDATSR